MAGIWWYAKRKHWAAQVKDPKTGKRPRWNLGKDERGARRRFHERMAEMFKDELVPHAAGESMEDLMGGFLGWAEVNCAPVTVDYYRVYFRWTTAYLLKRYGPRRAVAFALADFVPADMEAIKAAHRKSNAPGAINAFVRAMKRLYNWAWDQGWIEGNPLARVKGVPKDAHDPHPLPWPMVELVAAICDELPPLGDYVRVLAYTGMRCGELAGLPWSAYDPKDRTLTVKRHKTVRYHGKARVVPLRSEAAVIITAQPRTGGAIFADDAGVAYTTDALRKRLYRLKRTHPELDGFGFHVLRYTFATELARKGVPPSIAQALLGHTTVGMTLYYQALDMETLRAAAAKVGADDAT